MLILICPFSMASAPGNAPERQGYTFSNDFLWRRLQDQAPSVESEITFSWQLRGGWLKALIRGRTLICWPAAQLSGPSEPATHSTLKRHRASGLHCLCQTVRDC